MGTGERAGGCGERDEVGVGVGFIQRDVGRGEGRRLWGKGCREGTVGKGTVGKGMQGVDCGERDVGRGLWGKGCREGTVGKGM